MILIIGPAFSGKREYAKKVLSANREERSSKTDCREDGELSAGRDGSSSKTDRQEDGRDIFLTEVQELVTEDMDEDSLVELVQILCTRTAVLTASETGAGIVPVGKGERIRRELQGKLLSMLALRADCVVRVFYGLPEVLKGTLPAVDTGDRGRDICMKTVLTASDTGEEG